MGKLRETALWGILFTCMLCIRMPVHAENSAGGGKKNWYSLPADCIETNNLTDDNKYNFSQKNGHIEVKDDNSSFLKMSEWTNRSAGEGKITLQYKAPEFSEPSVAVFVFGTCQSHGFSASMAKSQIQELLQHYDRVDCITTYMRKGDMYYDAPSDNTYLTVSRQEMVNNVIKVTESFYAADDSLNDEKINSFLSPSTYDCFVDGAHWTGTQALRYLQTYLTDNNPTAIYVSFDGNRAFQNGNLTAGDGIENSAYALYGESCSDLDASGSYSMFDIDDGTMKKIGEYQKEGRYYVCISNYQYPNVSEIYPFQELNICNYYSNKKSSILLAYYSVATFAPYYFANYNDELQSYFDNAQLHYYSYFTQDLPNAAPVINYGTTFGSQGTVFAQKGLSITDTLSDKLVFSKDDIRVSVMDKDGNILSQQPDIEVFADGQNIKIEIAKLESEEAVVVEIPFMSDGTFSSDDGEFEKTNNGDATVELTGEDPLSLPSPRLYSQPIVLPSTGGSGNAKMYFAAFLLLILSFTLFMKKLKN